MVRVAPAFGPTLGQETAPVRAVPGDETAPGVGFHQGQVVSVELVKAIGADEGLFRISGRYFRALYPAGLAQGVTIPMRVVDTGPPLVLRLPDMIAQLLNRLVHPSTTGLPAAGAGLAKLVASGGLTGEAAGLAAKLSETFNLPDDPKLLAQALEKLFSRNGVFHEAFLSRGEDPADVKSLALRLLASLGGEDRAAPLLKAIISHVEAYQARSLIHENPVFPFYLNWGGEEIKGEFELKKGAEGGEEPRGGGLVVRLDMPNLGHVEAALWWHAGAVSVGLCVSQELYGWVKERVEPLREILREAGGINVSSLRVEAREPPKPATGRSLLEITV